MRVLVTGANGFVGAWLIQELAKHQVEIYAIVKDKNEDIKRIENIPNIHLIYCDLSQLHTLKTTISDKIDIFYHLAWIAAGGKGRADYSVQLTNVNYACDAATVASHLGCRKILFAGTITEKLAENILSLKSKAENNIYGICKHTTHCIVDVLCHKLSLDYVWMQFSNLYGPYSLNGNIVGYTIGELLKGNEATFGTAQNPYDLLYVEDLVKAMYMLGVETTKQNCYFLGTGHLRLLADFLKDIGDIYGKPELIKIGVRPDDGTIYDEKWFDNIPIENELGFKVSYTFEEGVKKTIDWMRTLHILDQK